METNWDLSAVVRGYTTITTPYSTTTTTTATSSTPSSFGIETPTSCNFFSLYNAEQSVKNSQSHHVASATIPRSLRRNHRKNQHKEVHKMQALNISSLDIWAWRKYGAKNIKGSPYQRGYYRCTETECLAKRQVDWNKSNSSMFIVTYFGRHNHHVPTSRNSLAGSTKKKPLLSTSRVEEEIAAPLIANSEEEIFKGLEELIPLP